jgi:hypothetical protein
MAQKQAIFIAFLLFFFSSTWAAVAMPENFELRKLEIAISLYPDGTAHVVETMRIFINTTQAIRLYQDTMQYNDLSTWVNRTGIDDLRVHINPAAVLIDNLEVHSKSPDNCNSLIGICFATLALEYDVRSSPSSKTAILLMEKYKPRTIRYTFQSEVLLLPKSSTGDVLLSPTTTLRLILPPDASNIRFSQIPSNLADETANLRYNPSQGYFGPIRQFTWTDQTLSKTPIIFEREATLQAEVFEYFNNLQKALLENALSYNGMALVLVFVVLLISAIWLHNIKLK